MMAPKVALMSIAFGPKLAFERATDSSHDVGCRFFESTQVLEPLIRQ